MGRPPVPLARPRRGYQPTQPRPEQNPPQSVSGVIPITVIGEAEPAGYINKQNGYWGVTAQEAADALAVLVGGAHHDPFELLRFMRSLGETEPTATPQEVGCVGYEEL